MNLSQANPARIDQSIRALLIACAGIVTEECARAVMHYLDHDEYEMALEGLLVDLVEAGRLPDGVDWQQMMAIARGLMLDQETGFDPNVWPRFSALVETRSS